MSELLRLEGITKSYRMPDGSSLDILSGVDLSLREGEVVSIAGRSGSGKSTLLSIAALLLAPDEGRILYEGKDVSGLSSKEMQRLRSRSVGFVFQSSLLLEDFTVLENAAMPLLIQGKKPREAYSEAERLPPSPLVIFADEPTGSLDERTAASIEALMLDTVRSEGRCMLTVTHNRDFAAKADRMLTLSEGRLFDGNV